MIVQLTQKLRAARLKQTPELPEGRWLGERRIDTEPTLSEINAKGEIQRAALDARYSGLRSSLEMDSALYSAQLTEIRAVYQPAENLEAAYPAMIVPLAGVLAGFWMVATDIVMLAPLAWGMAIRGEWQRYTFAAGVVLITLLLYESGGQWLRGVSPTKRVSGGGMIILGFLVSLVLALWRPGVLTEIAGLGSAGTGSSAARAASVLSSLAGRSGWILNALSVLMGIGLPIAA